MVNESSVFEPLKFYCISSSEFKDQKTNSVSPDVASHYELPHVGISDCLHVLGCCKC